MLRHGWLTKSEWEVAAQAARRCARCEGYRSNRIVKVRFPHTGAPDVAPSCLGDEIEQCALVRHGYDDEIVALGCPLFGDLRMLMPEGECCVY